MSELTAIKVPDIGDFKDVEVIEILVKVGDTIEAEQSLITVESDKASMEIPASESGVIKKIDIKLGDRVKEGSVIMHVEAGASSAASSDKGDESGKASGDESKADNTDSVESASPEKPAAGNAKEESAGQNSADVPPSPPGAAVGVRQTAALGSLPPPTVGLETSASPASLPHASPSVRKFARELGVDLSQVKGTGAKGRITQEDVQGFVKGVMQGGAAAPAGTGAGAGIGGLSLLPWPEVDFSKFGPIEAKPLSRIKKISGANLHRNWVMVPHVTNNDEADITEREALRKTLNEEYKREGVKVTMLAFLIKASVAALKKFPEFNASLDGDNLVLKQYYNIGFAADTPNGLVVPVIKDADKKGVLELAREMTELSAKARDGKLSPAQMQGGCFSISSLGGIGGTNFTPIINVPEVAILGVSRSFMKPVWDGKAFVPRLTLPLSLSYDHRVIDGAAGARFNAYLGALLADFRRIIL